MHVLHRVHRWLRPGGRVLDIHPEPEAARVEGQAAGQLMLVGPFDRPDIYDKIHAARSVLAEMVEAGLYLCERSVTFEVLYHFDTVEAWLAYRAERGSKASWNRRSRLMRESCSRPLQASC